MLVLVLDWTQCLPQGAGAAPANAAGVAMTGFPQNTGGPGPPEAGYIFRMLLLLSTYPLLRVAVEGSDNPVFSREALPGVVLNLAEICCCLIVSGCVSMLVV